MEKELTVKKTISKDTLFSFPSHLKAIEYKDKILVVSPDTANWLVLENAEQYCFFQLLESMDLGSALEQFQGEYREHLHSSVAKEL